MKRRCLAEFQLGKRDDLQTAQVVKKRNWPTKQGDSRLARRWAEVLHACVTTFLYPWSSTSQRSRNSRSATSPTVSVKLLIVLS